MTTQRRKILITGGHLTPAIATITQLQNHSTNILFVGRTHTGTSTSPAKEKTEVTQLGVKFQSLQSPKFHRKPLTKNLGEISKLPSSLIKANQIISNFQPDLILTFGGYLAIPLVITAKSKKIPILTHEQTRQLGLSNKLISKFANHIALSWPKPGLDPTNNHQGKYTLTGNPIRTEFTKPQSRPNWLPTTNKPLIFITGGNQGSFAINQAITQNLPSLTQEFFLIHQTGSASNKLIKFPKDQSNYISKSWFKASEIAWLINNSDLIIGRSGANTVTELLVSQARSILIPYPTSAAGEQQDNAKLLQNHTTAEILDQKHLIKLPSAIKSTIAKPKKPPSKQTVKLIKLHLHAATNLSNLCFHYSQPPTTPKQDH